MSDPPPRKRKRSREQTRDRMLEAAVELLRNEGLPALTTVRVTKEAGIVQSGFYAHFKNPEHLQQELADRVGRELREQIAEWMAALRVGPDDRASLAARYEEMLTLFREEREVIDLFLRYRRSPSQLGQVLGHLHTQLRADFFQYLRERAGAPDVIRAHLGTIGMHADTLVAALLGVAEGVVDGRIADLTTAANELAVITLDPLRQLVV
ncbi:MAG: TetR/AcrR family transcriptional regulator [Sandaracinaceae bacterium]